ncbi:MAG TPA: hypothetical protein H9677_01710 [Firmicutes bacterium]|nr:hypothetical protein [Bacillota bacterium]
MILPPTASQQAISAAIALAEGTGLALVLLMIAFFVKKLRLGKLWNAALQLFFCCAYFALCLCVEIFYFGGTFELHRIVCFCLSVIAGTALFVKIRKKVKRS